MAIPDYDIRDIEVMVEKAATDSRAADAYEAAVVLFLDDVLKPLRRSFKHAKKHGRDELNKAFGDAYTIGDVILATANNLWHYDEWSDHTQATTARKLKVLGCWRMRRRAL